MSFFSLNLIFTGFLSLLADEITIKLDVFTGFRRGFKVSKLR